LEIRTATGAIILTILARCDGVRLGQLRQSNALAALAQRSYACAFSISEINFGRRSSI
jgi:hypothetical protein